jgi:DNA repair protein RecN (Recombination protein N)
MLTGLYIKNYALIDHLEMDFSSGLSIITGETGAGKSILLGALGLILGQRVETQVMKDAEEKCVVEATFQIEGLSLEDFFKLNDIDYAPQTIIRREIKTSGSSRAFVNDTPVTLNVLKELGALLLDIHSQHHNLLLTEGKFQMEVLDAFSGNRNLLQEYALLFKQRAEIIKQRALLLEKEKNTKARQDYLQFQFDEISKLDIKSGELTQAEEQLKNLENSEEIKKALSTAENVLSEGEVNAVALMKSAVQQLTLAARFNKAAEELLNRLQSSVIEVADISAELAALNEEVGHDPEKIQLLSERVNILHHLLQKHSLKTDEELLELLAKIEEELSEGENLEQEIFALTQKEEALHKQLEELSIKLSKKRKDFAPKLKTEIENILLQLGLPHSKVEIEVNLITELTLSGKDKVNFLFSANKGASPNEISKVASGGEISRLMLAVKSILAKHKTLPAIIFDEIDTGVSGEIAGKLGNVLKALGENMQVIVITHLPQIAGKGQTHYSVFKTTEADKTRSGIKLLTTEERVLEIAKMLSGETPSAIALENARELMG